MLDRGRDEALRRARGRARRGAHARARALPAAADHRPALARAPLRHGLPARGHPPARVRPDRAARRLQERGVHALPGPDEHHLVGLRADDLQRRGRDRGPERRRRASPAHQGGRRRGALRTRAARSRTSRAPTAARATGSTPPRPARSRHRWSSSAASTSTSRSGATTRAGAARARSTRSATAPASEARRRHDPVTCVRAVDGAAAGGMGDGDGDEVHACSMRLGSHQFKSSFRLCHKLSLWGPPPRAHVPRGCAARRSFSRAAEALSLTQPAVSQQVAALERQAGAQLLERGPGGLSLPRRAACCSITRTSSPTGCARVRPARRAGRRGAAAAARRVSERARHASCLGDRAPPPVEPELEAEVVEALRVLADGVRAGGLAPCGLLPGRGPPRAASTRGPSAPTSTRSRSWRCCRSAIRPRATGPIVLARPSRNWRSAGSRPSREGLIGSAREAAASPPRSATSA